MRINGLELPAELEADLNAGGIKLDPQRVKRLRALLKHARFGGGCPYFLNLQGIELENGFWVDGGDYIPLLCGKKSFFRPPGDVDPAKVVSIAILNTDAPVALDYRKVPPRVVYMDGESKMGVWLTAASSYRQFKAKLGLPRTA